MLTKPVRQGRLRRFRTKPDGGMEEINRVDETTTAALDRIADAKYENEVAYFDLLREILEGQTPDAAELGRLKSALGKSDVDLQSDLEDRAAILADENEAARCDAERADLERQIGDLEKESERFNDELRTTCATCRELDAKIEQAHAAVAVEEKRERQTTLAANQAAAAGYKNAGEAIHQLQARLQNLKPGMSHVASLRSRRGQAEQRAKEEKSDRSMAPYVFAQQQDELPDEALHSVLNPPAPNGPPVSDVCGRPVRLGEEVTIGGKSIRLGVLDGEEVRVGVGRIA